MGRLELSMELQLECPMRNAFFAITVLIATMACTTAAAQGYMVSATLRSGVAVTGRLTAQSWSFDAISVSAQPVKVTVRRPPEWSSTKVALEIEWIPERSVYVIRDFAWTGELLSLWDTLPIVGADGKLIVIAGREVKSIRFESQQGARTGGAP